MPRSLLKTIDQLTDREFRSRFPDEDACKRYLMLCRWPEGVQCPRCGNADLYDASSFKPFHWLCTRCHPSGYRFSVLVGTIFQNKHLSLRDWFQVIHLMARVQTAADIQRVVRFGSRHTARIMCHRVRAVVADGNLAKIGRVVSPEIMRTGVLSRYERNALARRAAGLD
jgi:transposase-like protein